MGIFKPNIEKLKAKKDVEGLIKAFKDEDLYVRKDAAEALEKIGEPAVKPLIKVLNDENWGVRDRAAWVLGKIGEPAVEQLIEVLENEDIDVRRKAVKALGFIGDKRAVESLIKTLKDEDLYVRKDAAVALGKIGEPAAGALIEASKDENEMLEKTGDLLRKLGRFNEALKYYRCISIRPENLLFSFLSLAGGTVILWLSWWVYIIHYDDVAYWVKLAAWYIFPFNIIQFIIRLLICFLVPLIGLGLFCGGGSILVNNIFITCRRLYKKKSLQKSVNRQKRVLLK